MSDYLKPWRRKIGVVTLLIACLFAGGWVRSFNFEDEINIPIGREDDEFTKIHSFTSDQGGILWCAWYIDDSTGFAFYETYPSARRNNIATNDLIPKWHYIGFIFLDQQWFIPYWSIVIPLTLVSAWLVLSKPRATKSQSTNS